MSVRTEHAQLGNLEGYRIIIAPIYSLTDLCNMKRQKSSPETNSFSGVQIHSKLSSVSGFSMIHMKYV